MGLINRFSGKNKEEEQQKILEHEKEKAHRDAVEEQKKAHEGMAWPGIPRLNALNAQGRMAQATDSLTELKKDEVGELVYEPNLTPEMLDLLTEQELFFLQLTMALFNAKAPLTNYEKNYRVLYNEILGRIHRTEKFFLLMDRRTGYPLIDSGYVCVYFERNRADQAAEMYKSQFRDVAVIEQNGETLPSQEDGKRSMSLFDYLYYIGAENIMLDNGWYKCAVKRSEIAVPPNWNVDPQKAAPTNPKLAFAMIDYVSEVRWPVKYEKREEILKKKTDLMMRLIPTGKYIIPARVVDLNIGEVEADDEPKKPVKQFQLPAVKVNDKMYLPIFTDMLEYSKKFGKTEMKPIGFEYKNLLKHVTGEISGIIINPNGEGILIPREKAQSLLFALAGSGKKKTKSQNVAEEEKGQNSEQSTAEEKEADQDVENEEPTDKKD